MSKDKFQHHYIVSYNSEQWEDRTVIVSRSEPYTDVEQFVEEVQEDDKDASVQVEQFEPISGIAAFILSLF